MARPFTPPPPPLNVPAIKGGTGDIGKNFIIAAILVDFARFLLFIHLSVISYLLSLIVPIWREVQINQWENG